MDGTRSMIRTLAPALLLVLTFGGARGAATRSAVHAQDLSGISAAGESRILAQNLDPSQEATLVASFYSQSGQAPVMVTAPTTAAGDVAMFHLPLISQLPDGAYAARVDSDRQIGVVVGTRWPASGGAAFYNEVRPATDVVVPLVMKGYEAKCTLVTIQNSDFTGPAKLDVELYDSVGRDSPLVAQSYQVPPGASITLDVCSDPDFAAVPYGASGWMRVKSATEIAVQAFVDIEASQMGVYGFEGVPSDSAAARISAPLVEAAMPLQSGPAAKADLSTSIAVVNPGHDSIDVTVIYRGMDGACEGQTVVHGGGSATLAPSSQLIFSQEPAAPSTETGASGLPAGCRASATIAADGGEIVAVVVGEADDLTQAAAYNAVPFPTVPFLVHLPRLDNRGSPEVESLPRPVARSTESQVPGLGSELVYVPQIRRASEGATTGLQIMNLGRSETRIELKLSDGSGGWVTGCGEGCVATVQPLVSHHWWLGDVDVLQDGTLGWARIESSQPVAVVAYESSPSVSVDLVMFEGVRYESATSLWGNASPLGAASYSGAASAQPVMRLAPIVLK